MNNTNTQFVSQINDRMPADGGNGGRRMPADGGNGGRQRMPADGGSGGR